MAHFGMSGEERYGEKSGFSTITGIMLVVFIILGLIFGFAEDKPITKCYTDEEDGSVHCIELDPGPEQVYT